MALKFPLHNLRQNIGGEWRQEETWETITVPTSAIEGYYIVHLEEVPDNGQVNGVVQIYNTPTTTLTSSNTYPPPAGSYYVNYATGRIAFTSTHSGQSLSAHYYKKGSLIEAEDINWLATRIQEDFNSSYIISPTEPPSASVFYGQQWFNTLNGITYIWDIRDKWISSNRETITFGRKDPTNNSYLNYFGSQIPSNVSGIRMLRNACITGASVQVSSVTTPPAHHYRIEANSSPIGTIDVAGGAETGKVVNNLNIEMNEGDLLQVYFISDGSVIQTPIIMIEFAWRN